MRNLMETKEDAEDLESRIEKQEDELVKFQVSARKELTRHQDTLNYFKNLKIEKEIRKLNQINEETQAEVDKMQRMQEMKEDEVEKLKNKINQSELQGKNFAEERRDFRELQQRMLSKSAEIHNLPEEKGENLKELVKNIARKRMMDLNESEIEAVYRFKTRGKSFFRPVVVHFKNQTTRDEFVRRNKAYVIRQDEITHGGKSGEKILIYESLSRYFKSLLYESKLWAKNNGFKFTWYKNCRILFRKSEENKEYFSICSEEELKNLEGKVREFDVLSEVAKH